MTAHLITHKRLVALLRYDPETGLFRRRVATGYRGRHQAGSLCGCADDKGYVIVRIDGRSYKAHRLAWFYTHGSWPTDQIDHVNRAKADNRIANLRDATKAQNGQNQTLRRNNKSGHTGVSWSNTDTRWVVHIRANGVRHRIGAFTGLDAAVAARKQAEIALHTHRPT